MRITDEKFSVYMVCWADWCCQGLSCDARGYPKSSKFTQENTSSEFGSTVLIDDCSDLETIESYVRSLSIENIEAAEALRAHYEAAPKWHNLRVHQKCVYLGVPERKYRDRLGQAESAIKTLMQFNDFKSDMLA